MTSLLTGPVRLNQVAIYGYQGDVGMQITMARSTSETLVDGKWFIFKCLADVPDKFRGWFIVLK